MNQSVFYQFRIRCDQNISVLHDDEINDAADGVVNDIRMRKQIQELNLKIGEPKKYLITREAVPALRAVIAH